MMITQPLYHKDRSRNDRPAHRRRILMGYGIINGCRCISHENDLPTEPVLGPHMSCYVAEMIGFCSERSADAIATILRASAIILRHKHAPKRAEAARYLLGCAMSPDLGTELRTAVLRVLGQVEKSDRAESVRWEARRAISVRLEFQTQKVISRNKTAST